MHACYFTGTKIVFASFFLAIAGSLQTPIDLRAADDATFKPVVMVTPFENKTKYHDAIDVEVGTGNDPKNPKRKIKSDRYSEAPQSILENAVSNMKGVKVVERQRVDALLLEGEFIKNSGLVLDSDNAIKKGNMLGANLIVIGTLTEISEEMKSFKGYGVETKNLVVTSEVRVRILNDKGEQLFSKIFKGTKSYEGSNFSETKTGGDRKAGSDSGSKGSDRHFAALKVALEKAGEDTDFRESVQGKKGKVEVAGAILIEFAPKPDNCDIEIDGKYIGGSPLKRELKAGVEYKVKISKSGFKDWTGIISPEPGLKITRELEANR